MTHRSLVVSVYKAGKQMAKFQENSSSSNYDFDQVRALICTVQKQVNDYLTTLVQGEQNCKGK